MHVRFTKIKQVQTAGTYCERPVSGSRDLIRSLPVRLNLRSSRPSRGFQPLDSRLLLGMTGEER